MIARPKISQNDLDLTELESIKLWAGARGSLFDFSTGRDQVPQAEAAAVLRILRPRDTRRDLDPPPRPSQGRHLSGDGFSPVSRGSCDLSRVCEVYALKRGATRYIEGDRALISRL